MTPPRFLVQETPEQRLKENSIFDSMRKDISTPYFQGASRFKTDETRRRLDTQFVPIKMII